MTPYGCRGCGYGRASNGPIGSLRAKERKSTKRHLLPGFLASCRGQDCDELEMLSEETEAPVASGGCQRHPASHCHPGACLQLHSCPGPPSATSRPRSWPFPAHSHWPGALAEKLMTKIGSLAFEPANVYSLILPELGAKSQGARM